MCVWSGCYCMLFIILRRILDEIFGLLHCSERATEDQNVVDAELVSVQWCAVVRLHVVATSWCIVHGRLLLLSQVHTAGFVSDLPVHASSLDQVKSMCGELKCVLHSLHKPPTLVTIARYVLYTYWWPMCMLMYIV